MEQITQIAIKRAGGVSAVARACRITRQSVSEWKRIPAHHCITLERLCGISRKKLRPDVFVERGRFSARGVVALSR
jgi:hypothetical protein